MSTENVSPVANLEKCTVILLDVAGTTTSHSFVKDTLLSYVSKQAEDYLKTNWEESSVKEAIKALKDDTLDVAAASALVKELSEKNDENVGLKSIQGMIYKSGYDNGDLKAHVFSEVPSCFESWAKNRKVAIFSTGSVESQKLLFSHTSEGDISAHISKYFDQSIGKKTEASSYEKIAKELEVKPEEILFVTDLVAEAQAAKSAGLSTALVTREGNEALPEDASKEHPVISNFNEIVVEKTSKRKIEQSSSTEEQPPSKVAKTEEIVEEKPEEAKPADAGTSAERAKEEAMEVDGQQKSEEKIDESSEKPVEEVTESTAKPEEPSETDKQNESATAPEKTDEKPAESKTEESTEKQQTEDKPVAETAMETETNTEKVHEEKEKPITAETKKEDSCNKPVEEEKLEASTATKTEDKISDKKEETIEPTKVSEETEKKVEETKPEAVASTSGSDAAKVEENESEEEKPSVAEKSETTPENGVEKAENGTEKAENGTDKLENATEKIENGTEKVENGNSVESKVVEKENKSEMANGVEKESTNGVTEEQQNGDKTEGPSSSTEEIKVKKIGEPTESAPPVSVEV